MEKKIICCLTTAESKRLIAKGVVHLPEVQKAFRDGIVGLPQCTTNGYVYEELSGQIIDKAGYCCGFIHASGFCCTNSKKMHPEYVFVKGQEETVKNLLVYVDKMTHTDVIVKSGNILDIEGQAGLLAADPNGGEYGGLLPYIYAKGISLIVPMTLNKTAPVKLNQVMLEMGMEKISLEMSHGMAGLLPMPGKVITEIEALEILTGVTAMPVAMSGVGNGEGVVSLLIKGEPEKIAEAWKLITNIKGEPPLTPYYRCGQCKAAGSSGKCEVRIKMDYRNSKS